MSIQVLVTNKDKYLLVKAEGKGDNLPDVEQYVKKVIAEIIQPKSSRVLCDKVNLTHELTGVDTYALGKFVSEYAAAVERVAIVVSPADKPKEDFYELVTNNRGLYLKVFTDEKEAVGWISF